MAALRQSGPRVSPGDTTIRGSRSIHGADRAPSNVNTPQTILYDMATTTPAGTQLICEWYGVEDDKIAWIRALFDSAPFAFLRGQT